MEYYASLEDNLTLLVANWKWAMYAKDHEGADGNDMFFPNDGCTWKSYDDGGDDDDDDDDGGDDDDDDDDGGDGEDHHAAKMRVWGIGQNGIALEASLLLFRLRLARFWSNNGSPFHPKTTLDAEPVWPVAHVYVDEFVILILLATIPLQPIRALKDLPHR